LDVAKSLLLSEQPQTDKPTIFWYNSLSLVQYFWR
jgi:hypothetical protein